jgi:hypothetical protein
MHYFHWVFHRIFRQSTFGCLYFRQWLLFVFHACLVASVCISREPISDTITIQNHHTFTCLNLPNLFNFNPKLFQFATYRELFRGRGILYESDRHTDHCDGERAGGGIWARFDSFAGRGRIGFFLDACECASAHPRADREVE